MSTGAPECRAWDAQFAGLRFERVESVCPALDAIGPRLKRLRLHRNLTLAD
jgi:hypothetical protein